MADLTPEEIREKMRLLELPTDRRTEESEARLARLLHIEELRVDFESLPDGARIRLHPGEGNPLHTKPVAATYSQGYYYCDGSDPADGPDYYFRDVGVYCEGFELLDAEARA